MLVQFTVGNFLSFDEPVTFSMVATKGSDLPENVFSAKDKLELLRSAVIYGANASGKSNLFTAMRFLKSGVLFSAKESQAGEPIGVNRFRLNAENANKPAFFEIIFIKDGITYTYGFKADREKIYEEWLYRSKSRTVMLFERKEVDKINLGKGFEKEEILIAKTRQNALFLSVAAMFNNKVAIEILGWFKDFKISSGLRDEEFLDVTLEKLENPEFKKSILDFLKSSDQALLDIKMQKKKLSLEELPADMPEGLKKAIIGKTPPEVIKISTLHNKYHQKQVIGKEEFELEEESDGTQKLFALCGPIIDSLKNGKILVIDEFDARLHPIITRQLIELFNSPQTNSKNAQLIFNSHDTSFLDNTLFRRDQIWFTEKDQFEATCLYSLVEFKPRKDASYDKDYLKGKYGAIPFIRLASFIKAFSESYES